VNEIITAKNPYRVRIHRSGSVPNPPMRSTRNKEYFNDVDSITTFDGVRSRVFSQSPGLDARGRVTSRMMAQCTIHKGLFPSWDFSPGNFLNDFGSVAITEMLSALEYQILPESDGTYRLECVIPRKPPDLPVDYRYTFIVDPTKDYCFLKKQAAVRGDGGQWLVRHEIILDDWVLLNQVWLPRKAREILHAVAPGPKLKLKYDRLVTLIQWELNPLPKDSDFTLTFPAGTRVRDNERKVEYVVGQVDDSTVADQARQARALRDEYLAAQAVLPTAPSPGYSILSKFAFAALPVLVAISLVYLLWRRSSVG
jgi:hypothetical protein